MQVFNPYSLAISSIIILNLAAYLLLRDVATSKDYYFVAALAAVIYAAWQILREEYYSQHPALTDQLPEL
ncbi:MAG: hypothetical protein IZT55_05170 [Anaerolineae bacterium]|nr:hypothetical protein [Anaerolineae bacterium]